MAISISRDELKAWDIYHAVLRTATESEILDDELFQVHCESINFEWVNYDGCLNKKRIYLTIALRGNPTDVNKIESFLTCLGLNRTFIDKRSDKSHPKQYLIVYP